MKYSWDTDLLYSMSNFISIIMRFPVRMKQPVDGEILRQAVNIAINRYPYFKQKIDVDAEGGYILLPNDEPIVVTPTAEKNPLINTAESNFHLATVDYEGNNIYFNLCHNVSNGPGMMEWVLTTLYQYVCMKEGRKLNCPGIRMPDSPLLPDECAEINLETLPEEQPPIWKGHKEKTKTHNMLLATFTPMLTGNGVSQYKLVRIDEAQLMKYIKEKDGSPAALFSVLMMKAVDRIIAKRYPDIVIDMPVSTARVLGIPHCHADTTMHIHIHYKRDMAKWDTQKLCTVTRGNMFLQTDRSVAVDYWKKRITDWMEQEKVIGLKAKRKFHGKHSDLGNMLKATANISYIGRYDLGELSDYVDSVACIVDGERSFEAMALNGEFMLAFLQRDKRELCLKAFLQVLDEEGIAYKVEGPYEKHQSKMTLRTK